MIRLSDAEEQRRRALYDQGLTDREIAKRVGITRAGVRAWRARMGLPGHRARGGRPVDHEAHRRRREMLAGGMTVAEVAAAPSAARRRMCGVERDIAAAGLGAAAVLALLVACAWGHRLGLESAATSTTESSHVAD